MSSTEELWISSIREDLESLKTKEKFQRHDPQYHAEYQYKKDFFDFCPDSLITSPAMIEFFSVYKRGGSLYECVKAFLDKYEEEKEQEDEVREDKQKTVSERLRWEV